MAAAKSPEMPPSKATAAEVSSSKTTATETTATEIRERRLVLKSQT